MRSFPDRPRDQNQKNKPRFSHARFDRHGRLQLAHSTRTKNEFPFTLAHREWKEEAALTPLINKKARPASSRLKRPKSKDKAPFSSLLKSPLLQSALLQMLGEEAQHARVQFQAVFFPVESVSLVVLNHIRNFKPPSSERGHDLIRLVDMDPGVVCPLGYE